ncbi:MAG: DUF4232 domain-containing protein [Gemmatimonadota bacterium]
MKRLLIFLSAVSALGCQRPARSENADSAGLTPAPAVCRAADLEMSIEGSDAGAGQRGITFAMRNKGNAPCLTGGYPALRLADSLGHSLDSIAVLQIASSYEPIAVSSPFSLAPDSAAYFQITFTGIPAGITCYQADRLELVPPGAADTLVYRTPIAPCGDHLNLSPVRQGRPPM